MKSEYPEAVRNFELSIKIYENSGSKDDKLRSAGPLNSLAIIAGQTGDYLAARNYLERVRAIMGGIPETLDTALVVLNLGNVS